MIFNLLHIFATFPQFILGIWDALAAILKSLTTFFKMNHEKCGWTGFILKIWNSLQHDIIYTSNFRVQILCLIKIIYQFPVVFSMNWYRRYTFVARTSTYLLNDIRRVVFHRNKRTEWQDFLTGTEAFLYKVFNRI